MISIRSTRKFCCEDPSRIENYDKAVADTNHMWDCHHRAEILPCGIYSPDDLEKVGLYWKRPASELIFLRHDEHRALHARNMKPETRRRMSLSHKGKRVLMERLDGTTITFANSRRAVEWLSENGYPKAGRGNICKCARGLLKSCYCATWRYV